MADESMDEKRQRLLKRLAEEEQRKAGRGSGRRAQRRSPRESTSQATSERRSGDGPKAVSWVKKVAGVVALLAVGLLLGTWCSNLGSSPEARANRARVDAYVMAQTFVEQQLKAPKSAEFPPTRMADIRDLGQGRFQVLGTVDAPNSFGVMLRHNFDCTLQRVEGDRWRLLDISVTQQ